MLQDSKFELDHGDTLNTVHALANALEGIRDAEAEPLFRRALASYRKTQGPDGPLTINLTRDLATLLDRAGRPAEAEPLFRELITRQRAAPVDGAALAGTLFGLVRPKSFDPEKVGNGRVASPRVPGDPREDSAGSLEYVQREIVARRWTTWPEETRRRGVFVGPGLPRDEATRDKDPSASAEKPA